MATKKDCPHSSTVWIGWTDGGYFHGWKCQSCGEVLLPSGEEDGKEPEEG